MTRETPIFLSTLSLFAKLALDASNPTAAMTSFTEHSRLFYTSDVRAIDMESRVLHVCAPLPGRQCVFYVVEFVINIRICALLLWCVFVCDIPAALPQGCRMPRQCPAYW